MCSSQGGSQYIGPLIPSSSNGVLYITASSSIDLAISSGGDSLHHCTADSYCGLQDPFVVDKAAFKIGKWDKVGSS